MLYIKCKLDCYVCCYEKSITLIRNEKSELQVSKLNLLKPFEFRNSMVSDHSLCLLHDITKQCLHFSLALATLAQIFA